MANESIEIIKTINEELKIRKKQLSVLESQEAAENEKLANLNKLLHQAQVDHEICMRNNLSGDSTDEDLQKAKNNVMALNESVQACKDKLKFIAEARPKLNYEIPDRIGVRNVHRSIICAKLAEEFHMEMKKNKKLYEKLAEGYAVFSSSAHYDRSWLQHLFSCFPPPSERDIELASEKFKASNEFMRD